MEKAKLLRYLNDKETYDSICDAISAFVAKKEGINQNQCGTIIACNGCINVQIKYGDKTDNLQPISASKVGDTPESIIETIKDRITRSIIQKGSTKVYKLAPSEEQLSDSCNKLIMELDGTVHDLFVFKKTTKGMDALINDCVLNSIGAKTIKETLRQEYNHIKDAIRYDSVQEEVENSATNKIISHLIVVPQIRHDVLHEFYPDCELFKDISKEAEIYEGIADDIITPKKKVKLKDCTKYNMAFSGKDILVTCDDNGICKNIRILNGELVNIEYPTGWATRQKQAKAENFQEAIDYANSILSTLKHKPTRFTGTGLLNGKGDYGYDEKENFDFKLRRTLKTVTFTKDFEKWKDDIAEFLKSLDTEYDTEFEKHKQTCTLEALKKVDNFLERDIITEVMNGEQYFKSLCKTLVQNKDSRYHNIYTVADIERALRHLDKVDLVRYAEANQYYRDAYPDLRYLVECRKMKILTDNLYTFDEKYIKSICKDKTKELSDFEADYIYHQYQNKELTIPDYLVLIRCKNCKGFMAYNEEGINLRLSHAPKPIQALIEKQKELNVNATNTNKSSEENKEGWRVESYNSGWETRYRIVDASTGEILDDAQGWGYRSSKKAQARFRYKNHTTPSQRHEANSKRQAIKTWLRGHASFKASIEDDMFFADKCGEEYNYKDFVDALGGVSALANEIFTAKDLFDYMTK